MADHAHFGAAPEHRHGSVTSGYRHGSVTSAQGHRHKSVAEEPVTSVLPDGDVPIPPEGVEWDSDEEVLAALGYKPEFKREFGLFTTFAVSFAVLGLLPSFASTLTYGMGYAGTAGEFRSVSRIKCRF